MKKLTIWHTNDVHSRFEGFAAHAAYVRKNADPENDLFLDDVHIDDAKKALSVKITPVNTDGEMLLNAVLGEL